jgi:hypothetical protein
MPYSGTFPPHQGLILKGPFTQALPFVNIDKIPYIFGARAMGRQFCCTLLVLGFLVLLPSAMWAQKKNQEVSELATDQDYKLLQSVKDLTGKLAAVNTMSVTFRLDIPHLVPNPKYHPPKGNTTQQHQQLQSIYRQQAQIMATKNPIQRQIKMQQLMATMQSAQYQQLIQAAVANSNPNNQPFMLAHQYKDYDLDLSETVAIRKMELEKVYDDKGNIKTYSKEEKVDLKGSDPTKPGYKAKMEDLQTNQYVKIYLRMPKKTKPYSESDKTEDKAVDKDKDKNLDKDKDLDKADADLDKAKVADKTDAKTKTKVEVVKPIITMIVIQTPLDTQLAPDNVVPAKKKKDN